MDLVLEFMREAFIDTENTALFNVTSHPSLSLNIGNALPEDVSINLAMSTTFQISAKNYSQFWLYCVSCDRLYSIAIAVILGRRG